MDTFLLLSCLLIQCFLMIITPTMSQQSIPFEGPRLSAHPEFKSVSDHGIRASSTSTSSNTKFRTYYYKQTLDHFNYRPESFITFNHRYVIDFQYWGGAKTDAPIFVNLGEEAPLELDMKAIGFLHEQAPKLKALIVFIEHRYYGQSVPFGSRQEAFMNASRLGYFTSTQALADYAEVILHVKKMLMAERSPVVVFGASYGGMLASWFRLKYPHVAMGALASSAPILYFDDLVPRRGASQSCHDTIAQSWLEIAQLAEKPNGLQQLSRLFNTCSPLKSATVLGTYLILMYGSAAQYNRAPVYQVNRICEAIDGAPKGTSVLEKCTQRLLLITVERMCPVIILAGTGLLAKPQRVGLGRVLHNISDSIVAVTTTEGSHCLDVLYSSSDDPIWVIKQRAAEIEIIKEDDVENCREQFGVTPRPHWTVTEYGGLELLAALLLVKGRGRRGTRSSSAIKF
ncbi:hypothetical protein Syun_000629 [Stephania yunnanensis]|uniref:Uncharacterized protein n=1 Tax=Stephania yunnanensis TaxID=152371 RepID=A0AAP0Q6Y7_9MAGN